MEKADDVQPLPGSLPVGARDILRRDQITVTLTLALRLRFPRIRNQRQVFDNLRVGIEVTQQNATRLVRITGFKVRMDTG